LNADAVVPDQVLFEDILSALLLQHRNHEFPNLQQQFYLPLVEKKMRQAAAAAAAPECGSTTQTRLRRLRGHKRGACNYILFCFFGEREDQKSKSSCVLVDMAFLI
jgi:hypothetical protein